jgi:hypothetical protein
MTSMEGMGSEPITSAHGITQNLHLNSSQSFDLISIGYIEIVRS